MAINAPGKAGRRNRVLIVDDHPVVREGLAAQIGTQQDLEVCGEVGDLPAALEAFEHTQPDLAVVDISLGHANGLDLIRRVRSRYPSVRFVVWSMYPDRLYAERALHAGAMGYVNKGSQTREIVQAIRTVLAGKIYLSEETSTKLLGRLVGGGAGTTERFPIETLSDRELETFKLIGEGLTTEQVAKAMHVSPKTVETYRLRIKEKLGLSSFTELVQQAARWGAGPGEDRLPN
jgi:DNA-binding NarL/FixJ family response regulator